MTESPEDRDARVEAFRRSLAEATSAARTAEASANALSLTINGNGVKDEHGKPNLGLRGQLAAQTAEITRLDRGRKVNRRVAVLALVMVLLVGAGYWRFRSYQDCVNGKNDDRAKASVSFYLAEYEKVANQYAGMVELRDAAGDRAKAIEGFNRFIDATGKYKDRTARKLTELGVTITTLPNGDVRLDPPKSTSTGGC